MSSAGSPGRSGVGAPPPDGKGLGPHSPTSPAPPNATGRSPRAAVSVSNARAEASRKNGAKWRRAEDRGRQGALGAECAEARPAAEKHLARGGRRVRRTALVAAPPARLTPRPMPDHPAAPGFQTNPGRRRNRTNPSAPRRAAWTTSARSHPRPAAACTSPGRRGCRTNPRPAAQAPAAASRTNPGRTPSPMRAVATKAVRARGWAGPAGRRPGLPALRGPPGPRHGGASVLAHPAMRGLAARVGEEPTLRVILGQRGSSRCCPRPGSTPGSA